MADDINFCPRCGQTLDSEFRVGKIRPVCSNCGWIYFPDPKVAAGVVIFKENKVLMVRRANNPKKGYWTLPVGFVDAGENPADAAERECFEETGLRIRVTGLVDVFSGQEHPRGAHILIIYQGEIINGKVTASDDVDDVGFFDIGNLPPLAFATTQTIIGRIQ